MPPSLAELQDIMLKGIAAEDERILKLLRTPPNDTAEVMFGVYKHGYLLRLEEFLHNDQPRLLAYLGDDEFRNLTRAYAKAHPSDQPNARWFSRHLTAFLRSAEPWVQHADLAELAELEAALNTAFDCADAPVFALADLQNLDHSRFDAAVLTFHPSVQHITLATNASAIWTAMKAGVAPPETARLPEPDVIIAWRRNGAASWRVLPAEEAMAVAEAAKGLSFGVLCEMIAFMGDPGTAAVRAATYLRQWIDAGMITRIATD